MADGRQDLALVFSGGGARAAYQVGFLRYLARRFPDLRVPILTGVSSGAINAAYLASHPGPFAEAVDGLVELWQGLTVERVFRVDAWHLTRSLLRWGLSLLSGGLPGMPAVQGLVDTEPLRQLLSEKLGPGGGLASGVAENLRRGRLKALAISATSYASGQAVTWVQGRGVSEWRWVDRRSVNTEITVDHILASSALPLFFPAVKVGPVWYGDGGIRQTAPFSPALHLGAMRLMAISTRSHRIESTAEEPPEAGYPPPAQIVGALLNSIFLDVLDKDAQEIEIVNRLLERIPAGERSGRHPVRLFMLRPARELSRLAGTFEPRLPGMFRFLIRGLGTRRTTNADSLSLIMFDPRYLRLLMEVGEADAAAQGEEIAALLA